MARWNTVRKFYRYRRRMNGLAWHEKVHYVGNVLVGETFGRSVPGFGPRLIEITLTHRCQCACEHCYDATPENHHSAGDLTTEEVVSVLKQAREIGFTEVNFTGGEPLLRSDIVELVAVARASGLAPKINTNGVRLDAEMARRLADAGLSWGAVSIDSADPATHDTLRRREGCFDDAVAGIRHLVDLGVPASITTYARRDSIDGGLAQIVALGHELGVETVRILLPVPLGSYEDSVDQVLTPEEKARVRELLDDPIVTMESPRERSKCRAAVTKLNVAPDGTVTPCVFVPLGYGSVRETPLKVIWDVIAEFDRMQKVEGHCPMCDPEFRARLVLITEQKQGHPEPVG